jgi:23S rRNA (guanosine2251-2'-O)-methyltransferase
MATRRTTDDDLVVYGVNAVCALVRSRHPVRTVYVRRGQLPVAVREALRVTDAVVTDVSGADLDRLARGGRHQGVAAHAAAFRYADLSDVLAAEGRGVVVLDGVVDPRNLGAMVRSARAAGARGLVIPRDRSASMTAVAVAASAGTAFGFPVARVTNLSRTLATLREAGLWLVGLAADGDRLVAELPDLAEPALVVGGEGAGLRRLVREGCDFVARVPMAGGVESLNASVAAGIGLYELLVRRRNGV